MGFAGAVFRSWLFGYLFLVTEGLTNQYPTKSDMHIQAAIHIAPRLRDGHTSTLLASTTTAAGDDESLEACSTSVDGDEVGGADTGGDGGADGREGQRHMQPRLCPTHATCTALL